MRTGWREIGCKKKSMALIEFFDVSMSELDPEQLWGSNLEFPQSGSQTEGDMIELVGWVLGRQAPAVAVEVSAEGRLLRRAPVNIQRSDVAAFYPQAADSEQSGFRAEIHMTGMSELELLVQAVLRNQDRVPLGVIHARRRWRENLSDNSTPLVSVIIPCFNQGHFLTETIESVLAQSYPHLEVVVIDDGSTDNVEEIAGRYPGVRYIRQENSGLAAARNTGLRRSRGNYLVFLDADDRLMPNALEAGLAAFAAHPESAFVAGHCKPITVDGTPFPDSEQRCVDRDYYAALLSKCFIYPPATVMYRRSVFESVHNFDIAVSPCADYDLYLRIAKNFPISCHHHVVAEYRKHGANMTRNPELMLKSAVTVLGWQRKYTKGNPLWKESYKRGIRFIQECFGAPLVEEVRVQLQARNMRQAARTLMTLIRYYPQGIISLLHRSHS
jgi:glycosyltransferase involved in cell wall biosynthesis